MPKLITKLALIIIFGLILCPNVMATSKVQFEGGADNFVFYPEGDWAETDLFENLKGIMPGDKRSEIITIKNLASEYDYVKLYLRAKPASDRPANTSGDITMGDFLSQFDIDVYKDGDLISTSKASDAGPLASNFLLGTFKNDDEGLLTVEITAPNNLSNKYMHSQGEIEWIFTAEAYKDGVIINPYTNDDIIKYIAIATIAAIAIVLIIASTHRHSKAKTSHPTSS